MTGAAALTSSWLGARTAQEQIIAQHLQAAQQRIFEYVRDRREPRSQAYTDLIAQTQAVGTRISEMNRSEAYTDDGVHRILEEISTLLRSRARVMVEGPEVVADSTDDLIEAVMECQDALMALASIPGAPPEMRDKSHTELIELCRASLESYGEALGGFVEAAREALNDQGIGI
ncbi:hypothetical protein ACFY1A_47320 [Streptomyces sp. NPDC001520]|uniref:hypothetical protein n=1 Tax=Streptomyces sp. NPDC001520 TaxID=3364581 RepID=UPI0036C03BD4